MITKEQSEIIEDLVAEELKDGLSDIGAGYMKKYLEFLCQADAEHLLCALLNSDNIEDLQSDIIAIRKLKNSVVENIMKRGEE